MAASGLGLSEDERDALRGWASWILEEWTQYSSVVKINPPNPALNDLSHTDGKPVTDERLRRWAHTARRSRWSLLRDVVAESMRPLFESDELERIPLPADSPRLFELLCLVRISRFFAPHPREIRWLNLEVTGNTLRFDGATCHYQQALDRGRVLATPDYSGPLATAVDAFGLAVPKYIDLAFDFDRPRAGFDGIIVEAKSGKRQYEHTVPQLRTYRAARPRRYGDRYLVWGIVENPDSPEIPVAQVARTIAEAPPRKDVWIFSSADSIERILKAVLGGE